jgi:hypothetical protein
MNHELQQLNVIELKFPISTSLILRCYFSSLFNI